MQDEQFTPQFGLDLSSFLFLPFQSPLQKPDSKLYLNAHSTRLISENPCLCTAKAGSPIPGLYLNALRINKNSRKKLAALPFANILLLNGHVQSRNSVNSLCNVSQALALAGLFIDTAHRQRLFLHGENEADAGNVTKKEKPG